jgi:hypothetical protein
MKNPGLLNIKQKCQSALIETSTIVPAILLFSGPIAWDGNLSSER